MEKVQSFITARPEAGARALILFAAFVSFVLSVSLWFSGQKRRASSSACGCRRSSRSAPSSRGRVER